MQAPSRTPKPLDHLVLQGSPEDLAIAARFGTISYRELDILAGQMAMGLLAQGLRSGDRVAAWLPKTRAACVLPLAAARAGLVYVPINPLLKHAQVAHILADSGASLLVTQATRAETLGEGDRPSDCALITDEDALISDDVMPPSSRNPTELVEILYTSGSTGRPKGVMLSHANLWLGAVSVAHYLKVTPADRVLGALPFSFDYGQSQLLSTWAGGGCAVPLDYLTPRDVIKAVERFGVTSLAGVPPLWVQLAEIDWPVESLARIRRITNTGGRLPVPLVRELRAMFPAAELYLMYGLTEAFRSTYLDPALTDDHPDSIGRAIPFAEVMVVRPDGSLTDDGEPGELVHAGPLVAQGYWRDPARTAERFKPAPPASQQGGIAVWSGDTVVRDAEGLLRFSGRNDEMIKTAGNRVSPTEIEEAAIASGAVAEAVALGVPDPRLGEAILLVARPAGGSHEAAQEKLRSWFRAELPNYMQPREIRLRDALPRNPNGKLDRSAIRQEHLA
ncbi:acyl-CoA ligase (AMP-forming), exosortase A system-associated [Sphingomonas cavernae]|uniref:Acyl-CoA ligase (AMP-forming), exosortase A system-associated n=1 Tax=Sphingomonas cavernae TaxID=2320861 RepID=A0A418WNP4_9SPHN|nr:acyl-CoA ligase (AMP-forming), exosortase A system-associated [Sphingomonas cavernae]RJF91621.1 acyl-CoA ligase (AMP-forming), exosortase A system-associated [Sphingomonas cavernae]